MNLSLPDTWIKRVKHYEGFSVLPYQCPTGHWTIGYGHNLENGLTPIVADFILQQDLLTCMQELEKQFSWYAQLVPARKFVLIDMAFNMGMSKLKTFKKMLIACQAGQYEQAAEEMLKSVWARQVGYRALENANLMRRGKFEEEN